MKFAASSSNIIVLIHPRTPLHSILPSPLRSQPDGSSDDPFVNEAVLTLPKGSKYISY